MLSLLAEIQIRIGEPNIHIFIFSNIRQYMTHNCPRTLIPAGVEVAGLSCAVTADLVIVAVPKDFYHTLPVDLLKGKVVVDVSNRASIKAKSSE